MLDEVEKCWKKLKNKYFFFVTYKGNSLYSYHLLGFIWSSDWTLLFFSLPVFSLPSSPVSFSLSFITYSFDFVIFRNARPLSINTGIYSLTDLVSTLTHDPCSLPGAGNLIKERAQAQAVTEFGSWLFVILFL